MMTTNDGKQTIVVDAVDGRSSNRAIGFICVFSNVCTSVPFHYFS